MINEHVKALRQAMTPEEQQMWWLLRNRRFAGYKFRRQQPVGAFILDFACYRAKLVVELDGGQHDENRDYDRARTQWLEKRGWTVLRFWNNEFRGNEEGVLMVILEALASLSGQDALTPALSPRRGRKKVSASVGEGEGNNPHRTISSPGGEGEGDNLHRTIPSPGGEGEGNNPHRTIPSPGGEG